MWLKAVCVTSLTTVEMAATKETVSMNSKLKTDCYKEGFKRSTLITKLCGSETERHLRCKLYMAAVIHFCKYASEVNFSIGL